MKFLIVTHTPHWKDQGKLYAYGPYVREMNVWNKQADEVIVLAPRGKGNHTRIHWSYAENDIKWIEIPSFNVLTFQGAFQTLWKLPIILIFLIKAMGKADHIHLRCPGNIGLLGAIVQSLFPKKRKTAKYAGNWNPKAKQPLSYRIQKWWLSHTLLSRNMVVLVYGDWPGQSKNIKSFFTATYSDEDREFTEPRDYKQRPLRAVFVGSLSAGKRPLLAVKAIHSLRDQGYDIRLDLYGDGEMRSKIKKYIHENNLDSYIHKWGNQNANTVSEAYRNSHFLLLPSKSEGWPKVIAESMWWGCIPVATRVSCVAWMLDYGNRGILVSPAVEDVTHEMATAIDHPEMCLDKARKASKWSREYTLERFEQAIKELL